MFDIFKTPLRQGFDTVSERQTVSPTAQPASSVQALNFLCDLRVFVVAQLESP
jgi:hypothetical protein